MFSWTETILEGAKQHMREMAAEVSGVPVEPNKPDPSENTPNPIYYPFKLPITYLQYHQLRSLSSVVVQDLEMAPITDIVHIAPNADILSDKTRSLSSQTHSLSMYEHLFKPSHPFAKEMIHEWKKQFTTNIQYLQETQQVIQETPSSNPNFKFNHERLMEIWKDTKQDDFFLEKYCYVEWEVIKSCNRSPGFLQILSIANMLSPAVSLVIPLLFMIFPFIILKLRGIPVSFSVYLDVLKEIAKHHFIGKALVNLTAISWDKLAYVLITLGLYLYQVYQNVLLCFRFYRNIHKINDQLCDLRDYLGHSIQNMEGFVLAHRTKSTYAAFCATTEKHCVVLREFYAELEPIKPVKQFITKLGSIGYLLKCYYEMHSNPLYEESIRYSFGLEGFLDNLRGVKSHLSEGKIAMAKYDASANCVFDAQYYPPYYAQKHVKNNCTLDRKMIITGPNASGKTTLLKTTTINVILSQQMGCGFYGSCVLNPYTHIHSYLNIPDTSERDSLFQAESRRCKEIIDVIRENPENRGFRHYCIFDELYSGTNPIEATKSAYALLKYLTQFDHVDFILTTHYISICTKLKKCKQIRNYMMEVVCKEDGKIEYTYQVKRGISKVQGAVNILEDMDYPAEIIDSVRKDKKGNKKVKKSKA